MGKPERAAMTLDEAQDRFEQAKGPNFETAADLLRVALTYWSDAMISDETFGMLVGMVANDLRESA